MATATTTTCKKQIYVFNQFFFDCIKQLKKSDEGIKAALKKTYKVVELHDPAHLERFAGLVEQELVLLNALLSESPLEHEAVKGLELFPGLSVGHLAAEGRETAVLSYVYILGALAHVRDEEEVVLNKVLDVIRAAQAGLPTAVLLEQILDDDLVKLLNKLVALCTASTSPADAASAGGALPQLPFGADFLANSAIGSLAKEITDELNLTSIEKPEDILSAANIGNIVSTVGNKLKTKMATGELKQENLMNEAFGFLQNFGGGGGAKGGIASLLSNPMVADMIKNLGGGALGGGKGGKAAVNTGKLRNLSAQERLRRKLANKRNNKAGDAEDKE